MDNVPELRLVHTVSLPDSTPAEVEGSILISTSLLEEGHTVFEMVHAKR